MSADEHQVNLDGDTTLEFQFLQSPRRLRTRCNELHFVVLCKAQVLTSRAQLGTLQGDYRRGKCGCFLARAFLPT